jgi:hypothetical protein
MIVLSMEPDRSSPFHSIQLNHSSAEFIFQNVLRSMILASILKDDSTLSSTTFTRADKQQQIIEAEFNHKKRRDVPHFAHIVSDSFFNLFS